MKAKLIAIVAIFALVGCESPSSHLEYSEVEDNSNISITSYGYSKGRHRIITIKHDGKVYTIYNNYDGDNQSSCLLDTTNENQSTSPN